MCSVVHEMLDWSRLDETTYQRRIPPGIHKLVTVQAPMRKSLERWKCIAFRGHGISNNDENEDDDDDEVHRSQP